ncbi:hypothetical protein SELMODRAFT_417441 [Selaginella moellendorffii]|uniref:Uncharacterized protein n=1 Tax=Selaginella moellendorffii TaxID=88036 RepID=D8S284_SELML|nr:hypothetical protein SELMODRAFT_417441 [Selaginella moellendorffii]
MAMKRVYLVLDNSKMMCVEAMGVEKDGFICLDHTLACALFLLDVGAMVRMNASGTSTRFSPHFIKVVTPLELPPNMKMGRMLVGHDWPQGVLSVAKLHTLPELVADTDQFLATSADGNFGQGIRFYLGFKELGEQQHDITHHLVVERGGSLWGMGLGDGAYDRVGIPAFQLKLAKDMIMHDELAPTCFPANVCIDLYYIQSIILCNDFTTLRTSISESVVIVGVLIFKRVIKYSIF